MKEFDEISKWISCVSSNEDDSAIWDSLDQELIDMLSPIRGKLARHMYEVDKLKDELVKVKKESSFFQEALNSLPNPIFIKSHKSEFVFFNRSYEESFGVKREDFIGKCVVDSEYLSEEDRIKYEKQDQGLLRQLNSIHYEEDFIFSDGKMHQTLYWNKGFLVQSTGERGMVGEIVDISEQKELERKLSVSVDKLELANKVAKKAYHTDFATGLANRYVLNECLPELILKAKKKKSPLTAFIADLDNFKNINDTYGHAVGDEVLVAFANVMQYVCRKDDVCIRYGGEEFLVLMPETNVSEATAVAEKICKEISDKSILEDGKKVTVSIGATQYIIGENVDHWINRADKALYIKKNSGKNGVACV